MKKSKEIQFSKARQQLSGIVDEVERTGKPVKILRHGKVAAVMIGAREYEQKFESPAAAWRLAGSMTPGRGADLERALRELSDQNAQSSRRSLELAAKELSKG